MWLNDDDVKMGERERETETDIYIYTNRAPPCAPYKKKMVVLCAQVVGNENENIETNGKGDLVLMWQLWEGWNGVEMPSEVASLFHHKISRRHHAKHQKQNERS